MLDSIIRRLMALHKAEESHEHTLAGAVKSAFARAEEVSRADGQMIGVPTGFSKMDARLGGWNNSDLIFIGARPAMGKTALMVNLADAAAAAGHTIGVISGEMSALQYGQRAVSLESRVPAECMRNGQFREEDWPRLNAAVALLRSRKMHLYDRSAPSIEEIQRTARRWKQEFGIGLLLIDYLQRIRVRGADNRAEEVGEAARTLKDLARDLDIPVICLAQVVRDVDKLPDKLPGAGDLANTDEATREADQIIMLYRDDVYHDESAARGLAELNCEKNRHGPTGQFVLRFDGPTMRFSDPDDRF
jgi:replicative DNA helicase